MKRKDFEDVDDDDFFSLASKSRRLDAGSFVTINQDPRSAVQVVDQSPSPGGISVMQTDALPSDPLPSGDDEKALVVYNPANAQIFKAPDSRDFSIIVNSDLIPGLKDHIYSWGNSKPLKPVEDGVTEEENKEVSSGCLAVIPWVPSNLPPASVSLPEPMEAEEVEMMDTDDNGYSGMQASECGGMMGGSGGLQQWQQQQLHWMEPQLHQNSFTPVTW